MGQRTRRAALFRAIVLLLSVFLFTRARADTCALTDTGRFRVGWELGWLRAGFSGLPAAMVFTSPRDPHWPAIRECLLGELLRPEMRYYTGVLVHEELEPEPEAIARDQGFRVVVRRLSGNIDGLLEEGFACIELVRVLQDARLNGPPPSPSPIYAIMRQDPEVVEEIIAQDGCARAAEFVSYFEEFEPPDSPQVRTAVRILEEHCETFLRGDSNDDGSLDVSDPIAILGYLFLGSPSGLCEDAADSNDDGVTDVSDAVFLLTYLFTCAEHAIPPPFPLPGVDSTEDDLACTR